MIRDVKRKATENYFHTAGAIALPTNRQAIKKRRKTNKQNNMQDMKFKTDLFDVAENFFQADTDADVSDLLNTAFYLQLPL